MQYLLGKVSGKVPFWEYQQIPYIDAWGRHESSGNAGERALGNFVNPAYTSEIEESPVEQELLRLYKETGDAGVLPSRAEKSFNADGARRDLTAEEYVRYAEEKGRTALKLVSDLTGRDGYENLEDGAKAECVKDAYTYADQIAKLSIDDAYKPDAWVLKARDDAEAQGLPVDQYIISRHTEKDEDEEENFSDENLNADAYKAYAAQRSESYKDMVETMSGYDSFRLMDGETQQKAKNSAYKLAKSTALADNSDGEYTLDKKWMQWATGGEDAGVDETEAILFKLAYEMAESDLNAKGDPIPGTKKRHTLEQVREWMPWLTSGELRYLKSYYWKH